MGEFYHRGAEDTEGRAEDKLQENSLTAILLFLFSVYPNKTMKSPLIQLLSEINFIFR